MKKNTQNTQKTHASKCEPTPTTLTYAHFPSLSEQDRTEIRRALFTIVDSLNDYLTAMNAYVKDIHSVVCEYKESHDALLFGINLEHLTQTQFPKIQEICCKGNAARDAAGDLRRKLFERIHESNA